MTRVYRLIAALSLMSAAACGNTVDCPDSYGACVAHAEALNATYAECDNPTVFEIDEICDESLADPQVCADCVDFYECRGARVMCVEGSIETGDDDCPPCQ